VPVISASGHDPAEVAADSLPQRPAPTSVGPLFTGHFVVGTLIDEVSAGIMVYPLINGEYIA
jgi:hypothetical protein